MSVISQGMDGGPTQDRAHDYARHPTSGAFSFGFRLSGCNLKASGGIESRLQAYDQWESDVVKAHEGAFKVGPLRDSNVFYHPFVTSPENK